MIDFVFDTPHALSTRVEGSMKKLDGTPDVKNVQMFAETNNLPTDVVLMEQVHGGEIAIIENAEEAVIKGVDGLITDSNGISLGVVTADCLPVLFYNPERKVIGVAHAGSKGLLKQILYHMIKAFTATFKSNPEDLYIWIGPSIEMKCYEVGEELVEKFQKTFPSLSDMYKNENGKHFLDLRKTALQCLIEEGILKEHIQLSDECTKCNRDRLYSYRGGDKTGRFVSLISL